MELRRLLVDLYRVICQPTSFAAEVRALGFRERFVFMARMAPVMFATAALSVGSLSLILQALGLLFHWRLGGVWWEPTLVSIAAGVLVGAVWNVAMGVGAGMTWGPAYWLVTAVVLPFLPGLSAPVARVLGVTIPLGLALGVGLGVTGSTSRANAIWGSAAGLAIGVTVGPQAPLAYAISWVASFFAGYLRLEWYAVDVDVTLIQYLRARLRPAHARAALRASPIHWREPIWPPLLGLRAFLQLVGEHDYGAGVDECLFIIAERPTQAAAGRAALLRIFARHLARLDTLAKIAAAAHEVERPAAQGVQLPAALQAVLPELAELTRLAEQYQTATLPYSRRRALLRLREGADDLVRRLGVAPGPVARLLLSVIRAWRQIATSTLEQLGEEEQAAGFVHNPFVFGQPIEETETDLFVGRRDVVREIEVSLLGGSAKPTLVLWGPRRMGKTSVLLQLPRLLGNEFVPVFVDVQAMQVRESVQAFFCSVAAAAEGVLHRRGLAGPPLPIEELAASPFVAFAAWVQRVEERLGPDRRLLLCLDEFERLETSIREGRLPIELLDQLRHIIQHHPRVILLFAGSHRPDEMMLDWPDILISAKLVRVSYLTPEEGRQLVTRPVPDFEIGYASGAVEEILSRTRRQPYLVQALCYELVNHLNVENRREVTLADVELSVERALESAHLYFAEMWRQLDDEQRALVRTAAASPDGVSVAELATVISADEGRTEERLGELAERSILEPGDGRTWRPQVPMVAQWVRTRRGRRGRSA